MPVLWSPANPDTEGFPAIIVVVFVAKFTVANAFPRIMRMFPGIYASQAMCLTSDGPKFAVTSNQFGTTLENSNLWKKTLGLINVFRAQTVFICSSDAL